MPTDRVSNAICNRIHFRDDSRILPLRFIESARECIPPGLPRGARAKYGMVCSFAWLTLRKAVVQVKEIFYKIFLL